MSDGIEMPQWGMMEYIGRCWIQFTEDYRDPVLSLYGEQTWRGKDTLKFPRLRVICNPRADTIVFQHEKVVRKPNGKDGYEVSEVIEKVSIHKSNIVRVFSSGETLFKHPDPK